MFGLYVDGQMRVGSSQKPPAQDFSGSRSCLTRRVAVCWEPPVGSPLVGRDRVILTPHTSFYSEESLVELQVKAAEEVVRVLSGQAPRNPVNPEAVQRTA